VGRGRATLASLNQQSLSKLRPKEFKMRKYVTNKGYRMVYFRNGWGMLEHRLVMEKYLNRKLSPIEVIHHINGNRLDNRACNLEVMERGTHSRKHNLGKKRDYFPAWNKGMSTAPKVELECFVCDSTFNRELRKYRYSLKMGMRVVCCMKCRAILARRCGLRK
jgi:hypothetical protein